MQQKSFTPFQMAVLGVVASIPRGEVRTYKEVAMAAGYPNSARAVGSVMKHNWNPEIPCHRVIRSDGSLGQYNRGEDRKRARLVEEGAIQ